jgi:hypothetical protein
MNSTIFMMLALGGSMDQGALTSMINTMNDRRRRLFMKVADLLFGLYMFFFADLNVEVTIAGVKKSFDDPDLPPYAKLDGIIGALKTTDKGTRFRELMRPFLINAAEVLADLMAPDESLIALLARPAAPAGNVPAPPQRGSRL